ncbi:MULTISPECIES: ABC transporter substrate-binding protein [unclassified Nocardioides]|uniref:ABC transporter substrate-binding protein n=1 Tax=unclassified Nocardioides TaxID=2615069 RepID=UPI0006FB01C8|nr:MULTISPECIES: ABC transporter substrate-binding protein [unclassified Nocardioides]KQY50886.1 nitrate ABC transporter substrate-binding protein [Nocardioides sp. Root140]KQZ75623.1 nitrate ABC transporter substrate-binding protein [Nocardioides sp. Root151]KRF14691.1 nitrate ABC transporter substrate-binding protein [Nocardioides sp. Soil796]
MSTTRITTAAVAASLALLLSSCGSGSEAQQADGKLEKTKVTIGVLPLADYATVYWAKENGFFEDEGLTVELEPLQGGPVGVQKVAAGELDFSFTNSVSGSIAQAKGAPVQTVVLSSSLGPDSMGVFVEPDSDIKDLEDLDGKTIGINTTNNMGDVTFQSLVDSEGLDVKPEWIEVPFSEMIAGVEAGSIEAGYVPEPFKSAAEAAGLREVVDLAGGVNSEFAASTFIASDKFIDANPDTVAAFIDAMYAANADISKHEKEFRAWLPGVAGVDAKTAQTMSIPVFATELPTAGLEKVNKTLVDQGLVDDDFSILDHTYVPEK